MEFLFLTEPEAEGAVIRWGGPARKSAALIAAAVAAGFTEDEARFSPLGVLQEDFRLGPACVFRRGARVLIGSNGSTLIEVS